MSRKIHPLSKGKPKKEIDQDLIARFQQPSPEHQPPSSRKRLKKFADVNQSQEILPPDEDDATEKLNDEEQQEFKQFKMADDQDIKKEKERAEAAEKSKKLKGNQALDRFLSKRIDMEPKDKKQPKGKFMKNQLTLEMVAQFKKEKRQRRRSSDDFVVSDNAEASVEEKEREREREGEKEREREERRKEAQKQYKMMNGSMDNEQKLIDRAIKQSLSLTAVSQKNHSFDYPITDNEVNRRLQLPKKSATKQQMAPQAKQKKQTKKRGKSAGKSKQDKHKEGPLAGYVICFTGHYQDYDRDEIIQVCMQLGAECPKSLSKKCNILMQGSFIMNSFKRRQPTAIAETTKSKQALERGITIIPHDKLDGFFIEKTGSSLQHHIDLNKVRPNPITNFINKSIDEHYVQIKKDAPKEQFFKLYEYNQSEPPPTNHQPKPISKDQPMQIQIVEPKPKKLDNRLWPDKFKPLHMDQVMGENSQIKSLREWLSAWHDIHINGNKREVRDVKTWGGGGNINSKAALLSGDPGIGKTTTARLLAAEFNYMVSEFNASDVRNKSGVALLESGSYNLDSSKNLQKSLIIMDEVDGMSSGDRGGVASIIQMIKNSRVPIICICNDSSSEKIRSLANHCLPVKFHKPSKALLAKRLKEILASEGGSGEDRALEHLVETFQNDMRQILSYLEVIFRTVSNRITMDALSNRNKHAKDSAVMINHFDAARKLLNRSEFQSMRIPERVECFFVDSDLVPLMVHENLLTANKKKVFGREQLRSLVEGVEGMVVGDLLDRTIRKEQEWGLMPSYGFMTCVYSAEKIADSTGFPTFPSWLGKNSSERKNKRLARQLKNALFPVTLCASWRSVKQHYSVLLLLQLVQALKEENIEEAVLLMETYHITPTTLSEHLVSMPYGGDKNNPLAALSAQTKAKLTRLFNKRHEDAKLSKMQAKGGKAKAEHVKFNPVMEMAEQEEDQAEEQEQEEENSADYDLKARAKAKVAKKK